jgi:hypothetical protein
MGCAAKVMPRSNKKPRISLISAVRRCTSPEFWMVKLLDALDYFGGQAYMRDLRRRVNDHKDKQASAAALERLISLGCIRVERQGRRQLVTVVKIPRWAKRTRPPQKRQRHAPGSRGQTPWFKNLIRQRELQEEREEAMCGPDGYGGKAPESIFQDSGGGDFRAPWV